MPPESRTVLPFLQGLFYDLRFSLRRLRRDKVFTAMAISTLAVAIGLNVTVFAVMDTMLYRGFPLVKRNDRLVYMQEHFPSGQGNISYRDFEEWRSQAHSFLGMGFVAGKLIAFGDQNGRPQDMTTAEVSANTFGLLGVPPLLGRDFVPADEVPGAPQVVILNYRFWEGWYGKRSDIVGSNIRINGAPATIIGVMPARFDFPTQENLWMPVTHTAELQQRGITPAGFLAVGRMRMASACRARVGNWKPSTGVWQRPGRQPIVAWSPRCSLTRN